MRNIYIFSLSCIMLYVVFIVVLKSVNNHRNEWNAFLEANNCVLLKTAPTLRGTKCYICGDGITYCK